MWQGIGEWLQSRPVNDAGDMPWLGWDAWVDIRHTTWQ